MKVEMKNATDRYLVSPMQQGMIFESMLAPGSGVNISHLVCRMKREIEVETLQRSWQWIVDRYDVLRTRFLWRDIKEPLQEVCEFVTAPFEVRSWVGASPSEIQQLLESYLAEDQRQGFDLEVGSLFRIALFQLDCSDWMFVWSYHHAILDGRSRVIILKEMFRYYAACCSGEELQLPPAQPYRSYIDWLSAQTFAEAEDYWREFSGISPGLLPSPRDDQDEPITPKRYPTRKLEVSDDLNARLRVAAERHGVTLGAMIQGGWAILLSAYTGERDVIFGLTRSGRQKGPEGIEGMVGLFINTLPVCLRVDEGVPMTKWLQEIRRINIAMRSVEHAPLPAIQKISGRSAAAALFESLVVLESSDITTLASVESQGAEMSRFGFSLHALTLFGFLRPRLSLEISFDRCRFDEEMMERLVGQYQRLLEWMAAEPQARVGDLRLMSDAEWQQVVVDWSCGAEPYPAQRCLHHLFEEQVKRTPESPALEFKGVHWSYRELNERANQVANYLRARGVGPEALVGVCLKRSPEAIMALLGVLKAGGAYVPLDPTYPWERLRALAEAAGIRVLLSQRCFIDWVSSSVAPVVCLDSDWAAIAEESRLNPANLTTPQNLAYTIYTSGSTGFPKGVMIAHESVTAYVETARQMYQLKSIDRCLQFASLSFDTSVEEIFPCLASGATLVLRTEEMLQEVSTFYQKCAQWRITVLNLPTAYWHEIPSEWQRQGRVEFPKDIRLVIIGGERAHADKLKIWRRQLNGAVVLMNTYGPTETTVVATAADLTQKRKPGDTAREVEIGRPVANARVYILDRQGQPAPAGVKGEIYVGGAGVARGYLMRPDLTSERFVPDQFGGVGARLYRTGDLGRFLKDGSIEFLGREDRQVKIRGFRVETSEIETTLQKHPAVKQAVMSVREEPSGDTQIVGHYVKHESHAASEESLRTYLGERLPEYMVPSRLVQVESIPLTPNGKINWAALPAPERRRNEGYVKPRTATQELMAEVWASVLGMEHVGIHDNFFSLGGHSLLAMRVISQIRETFQHEIPLQYFFNHPTIAALVARLEAKKFKGEEWQPPLKKRAAGMNLPLSFAQQRLWFLQEFEGGVEYNMPMVLSFTGDLDRAALERALGAIISRHEALRTTFREVKGQVEQVAQETLPWQLPFVDVEEWEEQERGAEVRRIIAEQASERFDLRRGPLLRALLVRERARRHALVVTMHHIVSDGWSLGVLARELEAFYAGYSRGEEVELPELPIQYGDYAAWQREWLQGEELEKQMRYWREQLAGAPQALELPLMGTRPVTQSHKGARYRFVIEADLLQRLKDLSRREGVTLFMTLLGGFSILLSRYSGQQDLLIGTPVAGRTRAETEGLIGFFVNTLVLRVNVGGNPGVKEMLGRVREVALSGYGRQDAPFEKLVEELRPERDLSRNPLVQVMLALQNTPEQNWRLEGVDVEVEEVETGTAKVDLMLSLEERGMELQGRIDYSVDLFDREMMERLAGHYRRLLEGMVEEEKGGIEELRLLGEEEWRQIVVDWNRTGEDYRQGCCVQDLFEEQVEQTPEQVALEYEGRSWSYRELNERANLLARYLRAQGVGMEEVVGVCMERSPEMVMALLGILKAGAVYLPLDPAYPGERLAYMIRDAKAGVIITNRQHKHLAAFTNKVVCLDEEWGAGVEDAGRNLKLRVNPDSGAYVIYTSGSRGLPKGVIAPHRGLVNRLCTMWKRYPFTQREVCCQKTSASFVDSMAEIFSPMLQGVRLIIVPDDVVKDIYRFITMLSQHRVTRLVLVPSLLRHMLKLLPDFKDSLKHLKYWTVSGEPLPASLATAFRSALPEAILLNLYGSSEVAADATWAEISSMGIGGCVPIGRPMGNTEAYVLDRAMSPVPVGVPAELYIGGVGLSHGYAQRPDLTAEKFVPDSVSGRAGARLYRTGDCVRWLPDGNLEFLGRLDRQVKIRGFRIELGEVEAIMETHPVVQQAVVSLCEKSEGENQIVGYYTTKRGLSAEAEEIRKYLTERLPEYMAPASLIRIESMPLGPTGKIDHASLPSPEQALEKNYGAPRAPTEELMAGIWAEVLGVDRVGVYDSFFALGGHSLLAGQLIARVREVFRREVPLRRLFEQPTVEALSHWVERHQPAGEWSRIEIVDRAARHDNLPLSLNQEATLLREWWARMRRLPILPFHVARALSLKGHLDTVALEQSLQEIIKRHEVLKTSYSGMNRRVPISDLSASLAGFLGARTANGKYRDSAGSQPQSLFNQSVHTAVDFKLNMVNLEVLDEQEWQAEITRLFTEEAERPFDYETPPLMRAVLVRRNSIEHLLVLVLDHLVSDWWSLELLQRELMVFYQRFVNKSPLSLSSLPLQYADFAEWQRKELQGEALQSLISFWKDQWVRYPAIDIQELAFTRAEQASHYSSCVESILLDGAAFSDLKKLARQRGITLYMALLAALQIWLHLRTGKERIGVWGNFANRTRVELEPLIGWFANSHLLGMEVTAGSRVADLLEQAREVVLEASHHQALTGSLLWSAVLDGLDGHKRRRKVYDGSHIFFDLVNESPNSPAKGLVIEPSSVVNRRVTEFPLYIIGDVSDRCLTISIRYSTSRFDSQDIRAALADLRGILEQFVAFPQSLVRDIVIK